MHKSKGADLLYTNVKGARFDGADLIGTDLLHSAKSIAQLEAQVRVPRAARTPALRMRP